MPSDNAAVIIACISGAVSLAAAGGVEWSRRRTTRSLFRLQSQQAQDLARLRSDQERDLETFKEGLVKRREAVTKADEAERLVAKYRDPLLQSAYDLHSRIYNVYQPGGLRGRRDAEYFRMNTLFLLAEFLGWLEIIRREMQFLDLGATQATMELGSRLGTIQRLLATTSLWDDDCYIYRGEQRAIGEFNADSR